MPKPRVKAKFKKTSLPPSYFSLFKKDVLMLANQKTRKFSKEIAAEARDIIKNQEFKWKPLSDAYLDSKILKGLDERIYIATGDFLKHIGWWEKIVGKKALIFVGPKPGIHKPSGLTYQFLAKILEFGSLKANIPARPLWRPLLSRVVRRSKGFRQEYRNAIVRASRERAKQMKVKKVG